MEINNGQDMWARKYNKCIRCGRTAKPHEAKGYCHTCYTTVKGYRNEKRFDHKRGIVLKRDGKCTVCETHEKLRVHHIDCNKKNNDLNNLITLCNSCHSRLHSYLHFKNYFIDYPKLTSLGKTNKALGSRPRES